MYLNISLGECFDFLIVILFSFCVFKSRTAEKSMTFNRRVVLRIIICYLWTYDFYDPIRTAFDAGSSITRVSGGGGVGPWKSRLFWALWKWNGINSRHVRRVPFGPKKVEIFARVWACGEAFCVSGKLFTQAVRVPIPDIKWGWRRSSEAAMGGEDAQRPVFCVDEPKKMGARSARAFSAAKTH